MASVLVAKESKKKSKERLVGMAQLEVTNNSETLVSVALGSCVTVVLFDPWARVGGLAHIMLPSHKLARVDGRPAKFADTAVLALLNKMKRKGAKMKRIVAKLAGGARMFLGDGELNNDIGRRNVEAVKESLKQQGIKLAAEDTGGSHARTVKFFVNTGKILVCSARGNSKEI